nr:MAG TPA: hypothetical protein [Caudoviricetes sp.]
MKYQYNYGFLAKWLENNKKNLPKGAIQEAVGSKYEVSVQLRFSR